MDSAHNAFCAECILSPLAGLEARACSRAGGGARAQARAALAMFDYEAVESDELSLRAGDRHGPPPPPSPY